MQVTAGAANWYGMAWRGQAGLLAPVVRGITRCATFGVHFQAAYLRLAQSKVVLRHVLPKRERWLGFYLECKSPCVADASPLRTACSGGRLWRTTLAGDSGGRVWQDGFTWAGGNYRSKRWQLRHRSHPRNLEESFNVALSSRPCTSFNFFPLRTSHTTNTREKGRSKLS